MFTKIIEYFGIWESFELISELWSSTFHMGSHSVTCHLTQVNAPYQAGQ